MKSNYIAKTYYHSIALLKPNEIEQKTNTIEKILSSDQILYWEIR